MNNTDTSDRIVDLTMDLTMDPVADLADLAYAKSTRPNILDSETGFSLTELLVVLVIIGVLVALLALPRFTSVMTKAKTTEARLILRQVHSLQQAYYFEYNRYSEDLDDIGFEQAPLQTEGGNAYYKIELTTDDTEFRATATSSIDFDRDGTFNVWEVGPDGAIHEVVKD